MKQTIAFVLIVLGIMGFITPDVISVVLAGAGLLAAVWGFRKCAERELDYAIRRREVEEIIEQERLARE